MPTMTFPDEPPEDRDRPDEPDHRDSTDSWEWPVAPEAARGRQAPSAPDRHDPWGAWEPLMRPGPAASPGSTGSSGPAALSETPQARRAPRGVAPDDPWEAFEPLATRESLDGRRQPNAPYRSPRWETWTPPTKTRKPEAAQSQVIVPVEPPEPEPQAAWSHAADPVEPSGSRRPAHFRTDERLSEPPSFEQHPQSAQSAEAPEAPAQERWVYVPRRIPEPPAPALDEPRSPEPPWTPAPPRLPRRRPWHPAWSTRPDPFDGRLFTGDLPAWLWATRMPPPPPEMQAMLDRFERHLRTLH